MAYNLAVRCLHQTDNVSVYPHMSVKEIMERIRLQFNIIEDLFEVQVYDERFKRYIDFDDEYAEELRQIAPRTYKNTFTAEILFEEIGEITNVSALNDVPSPSYVQTDSPGCISVMEDIRSNTPTIDSKLCIFSSSFNKARSTMINYLNALSHVTFVRDVASYYRNQVTRINQYSTLIQGVKTNLDDASTCILPEIKFPSSFLRQDQFTFVIAVVTEERAEEQVTWRLDTSANLLRDDIQIDTQSCNPLYLTINRSTLENDDIFKLSLRMCTIDQNRDVTVGSIFYTLGLCDVQKLHSANHLPDTPRLACVMVNSNGNIQWDTFGLSDFMHSASHIKGKIETLDPITTDWRNQLDIPDVRESISTDETTCSLFKKYVRSIEEMTFAWFGSNWSEMHDSIVKLNQNVSPVLKFDKVDSFVEFLIRASNRKVVLIISSYPTETVISSLHSFPQLHSIYIFGTQYNNIEESIKKWEKVIGIYRDIEEICRTVQKTIQGYGHDLIPLNIAHASLNTDLDACNSLSKYRQIIQEVLLSFGRNEQIKQNFINSVRIPYTSNNPILHQIDDFQRDYLRSPSVWWYTKESYIYSLLNAALKTQSIDALFMMRRFISDLHNRFNRLQFFTSYDDHSLFVEDCIEPFGALSNDFIQKVEQHQIKSNKASIETGSIYDFYQQIQRLHLTTHQPVQTTLYRGQAIASDTGPNHISKVRLQNQQDYVSYVCR
ncbi:unnamed protein product [Adineta steineri]|uniref:Uncharacterized protein n=1 Tax=Adineta steineri TaxID=433720 RepID=A0A815U1X0_9BILA|nr:unnamed protein product [Adineta steineri]